MAMQSTYDIGCDDLEDESGAIDICAHCAADNKFQPALYFCFDCGVFGRCMCGDCNKLHKKFAHKHVVRSLSSPAERTRQHSDSSKLQEEIDRLKGDLESITSIKLENTRLQEEIKRLTTDLEDFKGQYNEAISDIKNKDDNAQEVERQYKLCVKRSENHKLENSTLQNEIKRLTKDLEDLKGLILENSRLKDEIHLLTQDLEYFKAKYDDVIYRKMQTDETANKMEEQHKLLVKQTEELTKRNNNFEEENKRLTLEGLKQQKEIKRLTKDLENFKDIKEKAFATVDKCGEEIRSLKASKEKLEDQIRRLEEQTALQKEQLQSEKDTKDDALRRPSAMASSKIRDNNPNIFDLRDQNRPTEIAEKLSELYDNQWTDAFDALQKDGKEDHKIIQELLEMLMKIFEECNRLAKDRFFEKVQDSIEFPVERKVHNRPVELPDQLKQQVKEFRRKRAAKVIKEIQEVVLQNVELVKQPHDIQSYLARCVEIGWMAAVQDRPLALCAKSPDRFDTNVFKDYTRTGPYVEYVVWPALLLHEHGPLLAKGVAQGCSVKPMSSLQNVNPNLPEERQNSDASDGGSSTPKKAVVGPRERQTGNGAHFSKTISASGNRITRLYTGGSNPNLKDSDF